MNPNTTVAAVRERFRADRPGLVHVVKRERSLQEALERGARALEGTLGPTEGDTVAVVFAPKKPRERMIEMRPRVRPVVEAAFPGCEIVAFSVKPGDPALVGATDFFGRTPVVFAVLEPASGELALVEPSGAPGWPDERLGLRVPPERALRILREERIVTDKSIIRVREGQTWTIGTGSAEIPPDDAARLVRQGAAEWVRDK